MLRKTMIALLATVSVGLFTVDTASARGGFGGARVAVCEVVDDDGARLELAAKSRRERLDRGHVPRRVVDVDDARVRGQCEVERVGADERAAAAVELAAVDNVLLRASEPA